MVARKSMGNKPLENLNSFLPSNGIFKLFLDKAIADDVDEKSNNAGLIRLLMPRMLCSVVSPCEFSGRKLAGVSQKNIICPHDNSSIHPMKKIVANAKRSHLGKGDSFESPATKATYADNSKKSAVSHSTTLFSPRKFS